MLGVHSIVWAEIARQHRAELLAEAASERRAVDPDGWERDDDSALVAVVHLVRPAEACDCEEGVA